MPQIAKIIRNNSAEGVSFMSQALVLITTSANVAYSVARDYPMRYLKHSTK